MNTIEHSEKKQSQVVVKKVEKNNNGLPNQKEGLNWNLPLLGALGFGFAFALFSAVTTTSFLIDKNATAYIFEITRNKNFGDIMSKGILVGAIGGGIMGLAYKEKTRAVWFLMSGAIGFGVAFVVAYSLMPDLLMKIYPVAGAVIGFVGGFALGLGANKGKLVLPLLLSLVGAIWFAIAFTIGINLPRDLCSSWNAWAGSFLCSPVDGWAGAIGGALFGMTLAIYDKVTSQQN
jgi:hypothetical protein